MSIDLVLSEIADAMTTVKLTAWLKKEGDPVNAGEPVVEVETDKTTVEIEAPASGVLGPIRVTVGTEGISVGTVLATIEDQPLPTPAKLFTPPPVAVPAPEIASTKPTEPEPAAAVAAKQAEQHHEPPLETPSDRATPLASRMARVAGLDVHAIAAPSRRVTKTDVERALGLTRQAGAEAVPRLATVPAPEPLGGQGFEEQPLSPVRRVTASRLQQAKQTVPHFYLRVDCRVDALISMRAQLNAYVSPDVKVTMTHLIIYAAAQALVHVPRANSAWAESVVRVYHDVDIAVAVNTPKGLITPVVRGCQSKRLIAISREFAALADRARKGVLKPNEYSGGTFTISNLGMFGVTSITPIINAPQACILGIGAIEDRPVVDIGRVVPGKIMSCTLAADHRAIDGATGAQLLAALKQLIENPVAMALGL